MHVNRRNTMDSANLRSRKMREQPIGKLLLNMSLPAILSMLVQALYNVVDSIFVANYSKNAGFGDAGITALSAVFPMQMLTMALAIGIGVGTNVQIAKRLGEGRNEDASAVARTGVFMAACGAVIAVILGLTASRPFAVAFAKGDKQVEDMAATYLTIVTAVSVGMFIEITLSKTLQATGNMKVPMISQLIGAITNIILDPLLIFGIGFFPTMGVRGAAIATVTGQICAMIFVIIMFIVKKHDVSLDFRKFRLRKENVSAICIIGLPTTVMNAVGGFTTLILNLFLNMISDSGVAILGVYFKLQSFIFMPVFGLMQGLMPILSYNYGYGDKKRFVHAYKLAQITSAIIMAVGLVLFQVLPRLLMGMFLSDPQAMSDGIFALRIISISFLPAAFGICMTNVMQAFGKGLTSLIMSLLRQVVLLIPLGALLAFTMGLNGFWFTYPIAEMVVFGVFLPYTIVTINKKFKGVTPLEDKPQDGGEPQGEEEIVAEEGEPSIQSVEG